ncbi:MAG TPA: FAD/NAD(P)-binding protein [Mucilaginibacter sp.]
MDKLHRIALLGGGPAALFMLKRLLETGRKDLEVTIFEQRRRLGMGMPYSTAGAGEEHITNVSANEIPELVTPIAEWIKTAPSTRLHFQLDGKFNNYKVLPRLLFGKYLANQFELLLEKVGKAGLKVHVHFESEVTDVAEKDGKITVTVNHRQKSQHDIAVMCTGHHWPAPHEGKVKGYFDSPYPPSKLELKLDHPVAIKGSSLTAVDAIRTLARQHGRFDGSGIFPTALAIEEIAASCKADGFVRKPFDLDVLLAEIRKFLPLGSLANSPEP